MGYRHVLSTFFVFVALHNNLSKSEHVELPKKIKLHNWATNRIMEFDFYNYVLL